MSTRLFIAPARASVAFITIVSLLTGSFVIIPTSIASADTEILTASNPGFETLNSGGNPTGWLPDTFADTVANPSASVTATFSTTTDAHSGAVAGQVKITAVTGTGDAKWIFTPPVGVTAGTAYSFSDYYKSDVPTSVYIYPDVGAPQWIGDTGTQSIWTKFEGATYLVPAGVHTVTVGHVITSVGTLKTDDYSLVESSAPSTFSQGIVTLSFDDGWDSFWNVASSSLNAHNFKATNYIITGPEGSNIGGVPNNGYMSTAQLLKLQNAGYDIAAHTRAHLDLAKDDPLTHGYSAGVGDPTGRSAMWTGEINGSRTDLTSNSFNNVDSFAYPYGSYCAPTLQDCSEANVLNAVKSVTGFLGARSVDQGYNLLNDLGNDNKYKLKMQHVTNNTTIGDIQGWINYARTNNVWLIIMFHNVRAGSELTGAANTQCIEDVIDANGDPVVPHQTQPDVDCTTSGVLDAMTAYLASLPTSGANSVSVQTMHQVLTTQIPLADVTPPVITVPASPMNVIATSSASIGAAVTFTATATDSNPASPAVTCFPASGSTFPLGDTTVTCTSSDAATPPNTATAAFVVNVTAPAPVNAAPVAQDQTVSATKNTTSTITLVATDADSASWTFATTSNPAHGSLTGSGATFFYLPATDYVGADSFTFTANDGTSTSNVAVVTINVSALPNHAPVPAPQSLSLTKNTDLAITLSATDADNDTLVFATTSNPAHGSLAGSGSSLTYTPDADYTGADSFTFSAGDGTATSTAVISLTINAPQSSGGGCSGSCGGGFVVGSGPLSLGYVTPGTGGQVLGASTQSLTDTQINAILDLLRTFGADQSVIDSTNKALHGQATGGTATAGFIFTKTLQTGSTSTEVTELQKRLTLEGVYSGPITGYFGALTKAGVTAYQKKHGLDQVGIVGPKTRAMLNGQ